MNNRYTGVPAWLSGGGAGAGTGNVRKRHNGTPVKSTPAWLQGFNPVQSTVNFLNKNMPTPKPQPYDGGRRSRVPAPATPNAQYTSPASAAWANWNKPGAILYQTGPDERKVVRTPDGQTVRMSPNTTITRPPREKKNEPKPSNSGSVRG